MDQELSSAPPRIAVTQHLDALHMYDAAYHQHRGNDEAPIEEAVPENTKPRLVSWGMYLWTTGVRTTINVIRQHSAVFVGATLSLLLLNATFDIYERYAAAPTYVQVRAFDSSYPDSVSNPYMFEKITSLYPLPANWLSSNLVIYSKLLLLTYFFRRMGRKSARHTQGVAPVLPATRVNIAHLTAEDSLVRASAMPADVQPGILLRAATYQTETPIEQLVRPSGLTE